MVRSGRSCKKEGDTSMGLDIPILGKYAVGEYGEVSGELGAGLL
jgi:hypothetical protein